MQVRCGMHTVRVMLFSPEKSELFSSVEVRLQFVVVCEEGCDLTGGVLKIFSEDGTAIGEVAISAFKDGVNYSECLTWKSPSQPGEHTLKAVFSREDGVHSETSHELTLSVKPHPVDVVAWVATSPVIAGERFKVFVGAKCTVGCSLRNSLMRVASQTGDVVGEVRLSGSRLPGTSIEYEEIELTAPKGEGAYTWSVCFSPQEPVTTHEERCSEFSFRVVPKPEITVTVRVLERSSRKPIENAAVALDRYVTYTNSDGVAVFHTVKGRFKLVVYHPYYTDFETEVSVTEDTELEALLTYSPPSF